MAIPDKGEFPVAVEETIITVVPAIELPGKTTEFLLLSFWESPSSLEVLTGPDVDGALPRELINQLPIVKSYEVIACHLPDKGHRS